MNEKFTEVIAGIKELLKEDLSKRDIVLIKELFYFYPNGIPDRGTLLSEMRSRNFPQTLYNLMSCFLKFSHYWERLTKNAGIISSPDNVYTRFQNIKNSPNEIMRGLYLNVKNEIAAVRTIAIGGYASVSCSASDIFYPAIRKNARHIILFHNHPSGDPLPSEEDFRFTRKVSEGAGLLGLTLLDHVIIGRDGYFSFKQKKLL